MEDHCAAIARRRTFRTPDSESVAAQMSLTLTLSRRTGEGIGQGRAESEVQVSFQCRGMVRHEGLEPPT